MQGFLTVDQTSFKWTFKCSFISDVIAFLNANPVVPVMLLIFWAGSYCSALSKAARPFGANTETSEMAN